MGPDAMILVFSFFCFKPASSLSSSFTFIKRLFAFCIYGGVRLLPYLRLLIFPQAILFPACESTNPSGILQDVHSAYKLNKQGDNIQPWYTPVPILKQSTVPCPVLTIASCPSFRFLKRQVRWSGIPISLRIFHSWLWSTQSKALA